WAKRVCTLLEQGATATLIAEASEAQLLRAGNVGGELLDWVAMLAAVGERRPKFVMPRMEQGHAFAAWSWSGAMSVYAVNYLCREVLRDHAFRAAMKTDPAAAIANYNLTAEERDALLAGDVAKLNRVGVNAFLMGYL